MGLIERTKEFISGITGKKIIPNGDIPITGNGDLSMINDLIRSGEKDKIICNCVSLSKKYMDKAMKFDDLMIAHQYEIVKDVLIAWYEKATIDNLNNKSVEYASLGALLTDFSRDPITKRCFESMPDNYSDALFMSDFKDQLALYINTNGIGVGWYGRIVRDFDNLLHLSPDANIYIKNQMAVLLEDKRDSYFHADEYLRAYKIWAKNSRKLDELRTKRLILDENFSS